MFFAIFALMILAVGWLVFSLVSENVAGIGYAVLQADHWSLVATGWPALGKFFTLGLFLGLLVMLLCGLLAAPIFVGWVQSRHDARVDQLHGAAEAELARVQESRVALERERAALSDKTVREVEKMRAALLLKHGEQVQALQSKLDGLLKRAGEAIQSKSLSEAKLRHQEETLKRARFKAARLKKQNEQLKA